VEALPLGRCCGGGTRRFHHREGQHRQHCRGTCYPTNSDHRSTSILGPRPATCLQAPLSVLHPNGAVAP
jgi:hypothetical protein